MNEYIRQGWDKKIGLTGLPYLTAPFHTLTSDINIYTTQPLSDYPEVTAENAFFELGRQTGIIIAQAAVKASSAKELQQVLSATAELFGVACPKPVQSGHMDIVKQAVRDNGQTIISTIEADSPAFPLTADAIKVLQSSESFGWMNPYLCI